VTSGNRTDRALNGILLFIAVLTAGSVIMLIVALPAIFSSNDNSSQVKQGNEMAACRSLLAYEVNSAKAELDILFALGLQAAVTDNDAQLEELAALIPDGAAKVRTALEQQRVGNELSRDDPGQFLVDCEDRP
jgi:hypothetical protein